MPIWEVILLGLIEGVTEFLPVSSTGHLLLDRALSRRLLAGQDVRGLDPARRHPGDLERLRRQADAHRLGAALRSPRAPLRLGILLAFLPAAVHRRGGPRLHQAGAVRDADAHLDHARSSAASFCWRSTACTLDVHYDDVMDYPPLLSFKIGFFQCLALVPGVSRSGATIVGAMLMGTDKRSAAEFSFFLAMPTMTGAFAFDLYKNWAILRPEDVTNIALGFVTAFIAAVFVVRYLLDYVSRHGFALFGWWRIIVGGAGAGRHAGARRHQRLPGPEARPEARASGRVRGRHRWSAPSAAPPYRARCAKHRGWTARARRARSRRAPSGDRRWHARVRAAGT